MSKIYVGTSGWSYNHWKDGVFYPKDLKSQDQILFYSRHFRTVEINSSFYHLVKPQVFRGWYKKTPNNFLFAVKASRFITHIKRLKDCKESWDRFVNSVKELKEKIGPILFQLPPRWKVNLDRLKSFLDILPSKYRYAFEFRDKSWFCEEIYKILNKKNIAICIADSPIFPSKKEVTADFVYIRFHGGKILYGSNYSERELKIWAGDIKKWKKQRLDVYAYFNNDARGYAVENARELIELLR